MKGEWLTETWRFLELGLPATWRKKSHIFLYRGLMECCLPGDVNYFHATQSSLDSPRKYFDLEDPEWLRRHSWRDSSTV